MKSIFDKGRRLYFSKVWTKYKSTVKLHRKDQQRKKINSPSLLELNSKQDLKPFVVV